MAEPRKSEPMKHPRLKAAFVVTVAAAAGCTKAAAPENKGPSEKIATGETAESNSWEASVHRISKGRCTYLPAGSCPKGGTCNPPPPMPVICPPELNDGGPASLAPAPPQGKQGWLRTVGQYYKYEGKCSFTRPAYCPPKGAGTTSCTATKQIPVPCDSPSPTSLHLSSIVYEDEAGGCMKLPEFTCTSPNGCEAPAGIIVACESARDAKPAR